MSQKDIRWKQRFSNFKKAFFQLEEAWKLKKPDLLQQQGIIQCFEYTFELAWKTLQDYLTEVRGYTDIRGPKPVIEQAFQDGIVKDGVCWMEMLQSRNMTSHLYDAKVVEEILQKVKKKYHPLFVELRTFFEKQ